MLLGAIIGATGVGKTALAVQVARALNAEIIAMDSRQIYQGFRIGTAQPSRQELEAVPHHLVGFLPPEQSYSAARFCADVEALLSANPGTDFLLVGGTGLYLNALTEGLSDVPASDPGIRMRLQKVAERRGLSYLYQRLIQMDRSAALLLQPTDSHRILRALEISLQTKLPWTLALAQKTHAPRSFPILWLDREREELYARIDKRVEQMFADGWMEEVRELCAQVSLECPAMQSLGYHEIAEVLAGRAEVGACKGLICQKTRNYAKRQLTWFRNKVTCERYIMGKSGEKSEILAVENFFKKNAQKP